MLYTMTPCIGGYVAASWHKTMGTRGSAQTIATIAALFLAPQILLFQYLKSAADDSTLAIPSGAICMMFALWSLVVFPFIVGGGVFIGQYLDIRSDHGTSTGYNRNPAMPWFVRTLPQVAISGIIPFSAFHIEFYDIFACIWGHKVSHELMILFWSLLSSLLCLWVISKFHFSAVLLATSQEQYLSSCCCELFSLSHQFWSVFFGIALYFFHVCLQVYIIWCILLVVFCILMALALFVIVGLRYFQLAVQDHRLWWYCFCTDLLWHSSKVDSCCHQMLPRFGHRQTSFFFKLMGILVATHVLDSGQHCFERLQFLRKAQKTTTISELRYHCSIPDDLMTVRIVKCEWDVWLL